VKIELNEIYHGDTFELVHEINDKSIDLIVCDGPYAVTNKKWDKIKNIQKFNLEIIKIFSNKLKNGGALYLFGKANCIDFIDYRPYLNLRSKIIWHQPSRLAQGRINYTNNYDVICYFIKGEKPLVFNLDDIRVPQMVSAEHQKRCERVPSVVGGKFSKTKFNKDGKNPGDVWGDIKQLTYNSKELISKDGLNTIQKPLKLIERIVKASSVEKDVVFDPFVGFGTCPVVCKKLNRNFIGMEKSEKNCKIAKKRVNDLSEDDIFIDEDFVEK